MERQMAWGGLVLVVVERRAGNLKAAYSNSRLSGTYVSYMFESGLPFLRYSATTAGRDPTCYTIVIYYSMDRTRCY